MQQARVPTVLMILPDIPAAPESAQSLQTFFRTLGHIACILAATVALSSTPAHAQTEARKIEEQETLFRMWTSQVGTSLEARFRALSSGKVSLEKLDGSVIEVPLTSLSSDDQEWIAQRTKTSQPTASSSAGTAASTGAIVIPADFPQDETIDSIPLLRRKRTQPWNFTFTDAVTQKQITSNQLRGKVVLVHSYYFNDSAGSQTLKELKLLHAKYADRGFEILTIHPYLHQSIDRYRRKNVIENLKQQAEDYGIEWPVSVSDKDGYNPIAEKITGERYVSNGWLFDPEGKLLHTNVYSYGLTTTSSSSETRAKPLPLSKALKTIFPD